MTDDPGESEDRIAEALRLLEGLATDKAALRKLARAKSWPEYVATRERLREAMRLARLPMKRTKARTNQRRLLAPEPPGRCYEISKSKEASEVIAKR